MVAIALPSTVIGPQTCYSLVQQTFALYEICRSCLMFDVSEIIIFDVPQEAPLSDAQENLQKHKFEKPAIQTARQLSQEAVIMANILQFFITPVYLRKLLFGKLKMFHYAKKLPRTPGFPKRDSGLVIGVAVPQKKSRKSGKHQKKGRAGGLNQTSYVNLGRDYVFKLSQPVPAYSRVIVNLAEKSAEPPTTKAPGYVVRAVANFSKVFTEASLTEGYSHTFFVPSQAFEGSSPVPSTISNASYSDVSSSKQPILVFGRWKDVQTAVAADPALEILADGLFDGCVSGFDHVRTEDALLAVLARSTA